QPNSDARPRAAAAAAGAVAPRHDGQGSAIPRAHRRGSTPYHGRTARARRRYGEDLDGAAHPRLPQGIRDRAHRSDAPALGRAVATLRPDARPAGCAPLSAAGLAERAPPPRSPTDATRE